MAETSTDTLTRTDLADIIHEEIGVSKHESIQIMDTLIEEIASSLEKGEAVKISSFGTFTPRYKEQRVGRNPKTGAVVPIKPRRVISFKASPVLKNKVAMEFSK